MHHRFIYIEPVAVERSLPIWNPEGTIDRQQTVGELFQQIDADASCTLTWREMQRVFGSEWIFGSEWRDLMLKADSDNDCQLSEEEFVCTILKLAEPYNDEQFKSEIFRIVDRMGYLSRDHGPLN